MPQTLTDIKSLLLSRGLHPKHRFGQNFLHDARKLEQIMEAAAVSEGDTILEVGPGTGALSVRLLEAGANLIVVEIDRDMEPILQEVFEPFGNRVQVLFADVLEGKHHLNPAVVALIAQQRFKMIANLPYNVASPLLINLAVDYPQMSAAVVTVQREVADRIIAPHGGKDYGPMTVMIQAMCEVKRIATLPPGCFWPAPKVDSAAVAIHRRDAPLTDDPAALSAMTHALFSKRRKQIGSILGRNIPWPDGVTPDMRPEQLSVSQIIALASAKIG